MKERVGGVVLVVTDDDCLGIEERVFSAMVDVPVGRCLFVLWEVSNGWGTSIPVESIVVQSMLGRPSERATNSWFFYGNGAVRLYEPSNSVPSSTWMWLGCRREGDKAYRRKQNEVLSQETIDSSAIPVSHKVFTRDVANNLWHLSARDGVARIIRRIQALTTWADEIVLVRHDNRVEKWTHLPLDCSDDLVPVAEKIVYECEGLELFRPGKQKIKIAQQTSLF
jgi:hypothetical protein